MFGKLMKYELRALAKAGIPVIIAIAAAVSFSTVLCFTTSGVESTAMQFLSALFTLLGFPLIGAGVVLLIVVIVVRFRRTMLGDEGYLTHTLPVSLTALLWSKLLSALIWLCVVAAAALAGVVLCAINTSMTFGVMSAKQYAATLRDTVQVLADWNTLYYTSLGVLVLLFVLLQFFTALSIGHSFPAKKMGYSVLFYFAIDGTLRVVSSLGLILPLDLWSSMGSDIVLRVALPLVTAAYSGVLYFLTWRMQSRHLNLA